MKESALSKTTRIETNLVSNLMRLYDFLSIIVGSENVALAYPDRVTRPGLFIVFADTDVSFDKDLGGYTNFTSTSYTVDVWHDTRLEVQQVTNILAHAMEGTIFQVQSVRPVWVDGNKKKWHQEMTVRVMEDFI